MRFTLVLERKPVWSPLRVLTLSLHCRFRRRSSQAGAAGGGDGDNNDDATPKRYLNGRITKLHNVRAEPIREAKVVGYLLATKEVSRFSVCET